MELPKEFESYWSGIARLAAVDFAERAAGVGAARRIKAYFRKNRLGGSFWLEIGEPCEDIRLIDIEIQREVRPITLRARVWYDAGNKSRARQHIELALVSLGNEEVRCAAIKPRASWERQLADAGVAVEGVEYPLRRVAFLTSPTEMRTAIAEILSDLWGVVIGVREGNVVSSKYLFPEEVGELESLLYEGAVSNVNVNKYERNRRARELCLAHYGAECRVCNIRFFDKYGEIGKGFMHVHHVVELSATQGQYTVDPVRDLVPVCPNCHAMLHQRKPPLSVDELRAMLKP